MKHFLHILSIVLALACTGSIYAQEDGTIPLQQKFTSYQQQHLQEKIYLHTDKDFYLAGETIWFKAYIMDAFFHKPLPVSTIAYVEVIDRNKRPVMQTAMDISKSQAAGSGSFIIPSSIPSDKYTLRAYTNWMKNQSDALFFSKQISIVNTFAASVSGISVKQPDTVSINFYPEGGNLVDGLPARVAFRLTHKNGNAFNGTGTISHGDTIIKFAATGNGTGSFYFTPHKNTPSKIVIDNSSVAYKVNWPLIHDKGYVLRLNRRPNEIKLLVQTNIRKAGSVYLLVHTRQVLKLFKQAAVDANGFADFIIPSADIGDGISHFILFNEKQQPVCERLFFKPPVHNAAAGISTDKESYAVRELVKVSVDVKDEAANPVKANLSAAVFLLDSLQKQPAENIVTYLMLTSELGDRIDDPVQYFAGGDPSSNEMLDNIMLVNGWSRFRWEDIANNSEPCFAYLPEKEGQVIKARVINKKNGQPAVHTACFLSVPGERFTLANAVTNENGMVNFIFTRAYQRNEFILQTVSPADSQYTFEVEPYYYPVRTMTQPALLDITSRYKNSLQQRSTYMQVENSYAIDRKRMTVESIEKDTTVFYGHTAKQYRLDDYTRFLTMEEVLKEYVSEVTVKKAGGRFNFRVKDNATGIFFDNAPLILIDGVPVNDADKMMAFDPLKLRSVDVVAGRYFHYTQVYEGIVSFKTYNGDLGGYELDTDNVAIEYNALQRQQEFYQPVYDTEEKKKSRLPDFRNVLLWLPQVNFTGNAAFFDFYTSGCTGTFLVFLQGLSENGLPVAAMKTIEVLP